MATRRARRRVDGVLLLDKPVGMTSNAALQVAKRLFDADKAGHTGTLDPFASGLLPLCFGEATKFAQMLLDAPKAYRATVRFGVRTDSGDLTGVPLEERPVGFDVSALEPALAALRGPIRQVPPMHSALKHDGRPLYDYARKGIEVERPAREVHVHTLELVEWRSPDAVVTVRCSKGTYVRVLAESLGEALGCGAHLAALSRTGSGAFTLAEAVTLDELDALDMAGRDARLAPVERLVDSLPVLEVDAATARALRLGQSPRSPADAGSYRCHAPAAGFIGVVDAADGALRVRRLMQTGATPGEGAAAGVAAPLYPAAPD